MGRLVVVSNRIAPPDDKKASAGGLAVGVLGALKATGGLWFGWSGDIGNEDRPLKKESRGDITWASFNLSEKDYEEYYCQFSNAVLWPAFHYRLDLVKYQREAWEGYSRVNGLLADKLLPLVEEDDIIWVHDYHLLPFAGELRKRGVNNRIGFFLHIPFPTPEIFNALPPGEELLEELCDYDLLGFQTDNDRLAFLDCVASKTRLTSHDDGSHSAWGKAFRTEVYPIGIEPDEIAADASGPLPPMSIEATRSARPGSQPGSGSRSGRATEAKKASVWPP
jgi:trehalose 6-phosphate synthase